MPSWAPADALPFTCPVCGAHLAARKSWAMQSGMNTGSATCPRCETYLHLQVADQDGTETMRAQPWIEYRWQVTKGLAWNDDDLIMYRADWLSERVRRHGWSLLRAVRYALKQGRFRTAFLSRLSFHRGAGEAMREVAAAEQARCQQRDGRYQFQVDERCALLEYYAAQSAPAPAVPA